MTTNNCIIQPFPATVPQGGTGVASVTAYAPICAGTTTTGAFQAANTGQSTVGFVWTSNGASALPSFQAAGGSGISYGKAYPIAVGQFTG